MSARLWATFLEDRGAGGEVPAVSDEEREQSGEPDGDHAERDEGRRVGKPGDGGQQRSRPK